MYSSPHAIAHPQRAAFIMASTGETVSYAELNSRSNRLAHLLRANGLQRLDHYSIFMENNNRYVESCAAGERSGHYYTCINSYLKPDELTYILNNSDAKLLITSKACFDVARVALAHCPNVKLCLVVGGSEMAREGMLAEHIGATRIEDFDAALEVFPTTPISNEFLGTSMLYSSGTTGLPKGILRPLPEDKPENPLPLYHFLHKLWHYRPEMIYLSPAPLYHAAPQAAVALAIRAGGTVIIMEHFDPEQYLSLVEKYHITHSQLVPTMFSRMLKLPAETRNKYSLASMEIAIHAAAPCPPQVKEQMIEWWGPIIHEYYGATEGLGFTACDSAEWLAHRGSVGKVLLGDLHILDESMQPIPKGASGEIWFKTATPFEYFNDAKRTALTRSADGTMTTVGDVGYVDEDGFLYLTDRSSFMIISGGVNIYPQECENLLITHPKIADAAVFGVPNEDLGEEVKAVVQLMPSQKASPELAQELIQFCSEHLSRQKVPRSIDFTEQLPRLPTGKLYKKALRDQYWLDKKSRIL